MSFQFNADYAGDVDQDQIESESIRFPTIMFNSGDSSKRPKKNQADTGVSWRGGFFIPKDALGDGVDLSDQEWIEDSFIAHSGGEVEGWYKPQVSLMHITRRRRWEVKDAGLNFAWKDSKIAKEAGNMRGHQQSLIIAKGLEDFGPFCLSMRGHTQMAFNGDMEYANSGCLTTFKRTVIQKANDVTKAATAKGVKAAVWDYYGFWLTVGASVTADGEPLFFEVGKGKKTSHVVLPVPVGLPATAAEVDLNQYFVGPDMLHLARTTLDMLKSSGWLYAWDNLTQGGDDEPVKKKAVVEELASLAEEAGI